MQLRARVERACAGERSQHDDTAGPTELNARGSHESIKKQVRSADQSGEVVAAMVALAEEPGGRAESNRRATEMGPQTMTS